MSQQQQKQDDEARMMKSLEVLQRIQFSVKAAIWLITSATHLSESRVHSHLFNAATEDDVRFLAAELGLVSEFKKSQEAS